MAIDASGNPDIDASERIKRAALTQADHRYSDARDNEYRRLEVMSASQDMYYDVAQEMKYTEYDTGISYEDYSNREQDITNPESRLNLEGKSNVRTFSEKTNCFADTVDFEIGLELDSNTTSYKLQKS